MPQTPPPRLVPPDGSLHLVLGCLNTISSGVALEQFVPALLLNFSHPVSVSTVVAIGVQAATALHLLIRWFLGNAKYAAQVHGKTGDWRPAVMGGKPHRSYWTNRFAMDLLWYVAQGLLMALLCGSIGHPPFWNFVVGLLLADGWLILCDRNLLPKWALWMLEGWRLGFHTGRSVVHLNYVENHPPRAWVYSNLVTVAAILLSAVFLNHFGLSDPYTSMVYAVITAVNALIDYRATRFGHCGRLPQFNKAP